MSGEVIGLQKTLDGMNHKVAELQGITVKGVEDVSLDLLRRSVGRAPLDKGDLRGSGVVIMGEQEVARGDAAGNVASTGSPPPGAEPNAVVAYGQVYAHWLHEDRNYTPQEPGTGPDYLAGPLRQQGSRYVQHLADEYRRTLR